MYVEGDEMKKTSLLMILGLALVLGSAAAPKANAGVVFGVGVGVPVYPVRAYGYVGPRYYAPRYYAPSYYASGYVAGPYVAPYFGYGYGPVYRRYRAPYRYGRYYDRHYDRRFEHREFRDYRR
jgi:hypothetical protein